VLQPLYCNGYPGHDARLGIGDGLLQDSHADVHKAHAAPPVRIHLAVQTSDAARVALQAAHQHYDRHHRQLSIYTFQVAQAAALQLEDPRFLIMEQLLAADVRALVPQKDWVFQSLLRPRQALMISAPSAMRKGVAGAPNHLQNCAA
jgi:hypothetical protein